MADGPRRIRRLSSGTQTLLASPLQILSLHDVVLELVKNSLDAQATNIEIRLDLSRGFCFVLDNGYGIMGDEFTATGGLAKPHHTSKFGSESYGRRGCFLASLARLSVLAISSSHASSDVVHSMVLKDGERVASGGTNGPTTALERRRQGTKVTVHDLFGKMPVRVRYKRHRYEDGQELERDYNTLKLQLVGLLLASSTAVSIDVTEETLKGKMRYRAPHPRASQEVDNLQSRVTSVISQLSLIHRVDGSAWRTASIKTHNLSISAVFNLQPLPTKSLQFISIGQIPVASSATFLYSHVNALFEQSDFGTGTMGTTQRAVDRWPMFYIRIEYAEEASQPQVPPNTDKIIEIATDALRDLTLEFLEAHGIRRRSNLMAATRKAGGSAQLHMQASIFDAWSRIKSARSINQNELVSGLPFVGKTLGKSCSAEPNQMAINPRTGMALPSQCARICQQPKVRSNQDVIATANVIQQKWSTHSMSEDTIPILTEANIGCDSIDKNDLRTARVLGQLDNKFIMAIIGNWIVMIDQHAADERIKIEEYFAQACVPTRVVLPIPMHFELESNEVELYQRAQPYLSSWGIDFVVKHEADFKAAVSITALPEVVAERCRLQPQILAHMLRKEIWTTHETIRRYCEPTNDWLTNIAHCPQGILGMLVSRACRSAIMFNDVLSLEQAQSLVQKLGQCLFPFQCAHGRPSMTVTAEVRMEEKWNEDPSNFGRGWRAWENER